MVVISRQKSTSQSPSHTAARRPAVDWTPPPGQEHRLYTCGWLRVRVWNLLESPASSAAAFIWMCVNLSIIAISSSAFVLVTHPTLCCGRYQSEFVTIEIICVAFFTVEYVLRLVHYCVCVCKRARAPARSEAGTGAWDAIAREHNPLNNAGARVRACTHTRTSVHGAAAEAESSGARGRADVLEVRCRPDVPQEPAVVRNLSYECD
jgi:hypothetical protein